MSGYVIRGLVKIQGEKMSLPMKDHELKVLPITAEDLLEASLPRLMVLAGYDIEEFEKLKSIQATMRAEL